MAVVTGVVAVLICRIMTVSSVVSKEFVKLDGDWFGVPFSVGTPLGYWHIDWMNKCPMCAVEYPHHFPHRIDWPPNTDAVSVGSGCQTE